MEPRVDDPFVAAVERELRRRRDDTAEPCMSCGEKIQRCDAYMSVRGGAVHSSCAPPSLFLKAAPEPA
jgi:hypothetical protein